MLLYNGTEFGRGTIFGTQEADTIEIKNHLGNILKFSILWQHFNMIISLKAFDEGVKGH